MPQPTKKDGKGTDKKKKYTLRERVRKHVEDKDDKITDDDIRDASIGEKVSMEEEEDASELASSVKKNKKITPWEILDEDNIHP